MTTSVQHLYLAGPYTTHDPVINTHAVIQVATILFDRRLYVPHLPHLTLFWHMVTPRPIEFWYELDKHYLSRCDAFCRLPGDSTGADGEQDEANRLGLDWVPFMSLPAEAIAAWRDREVPHAHLAG
jgi:hypothetical protein